MKIKAVIFDLDDTLYDFKSLEPSAIKAVEEYCEIELGIESGIFRESFARGRIYTKEILGNVAASHNRLLYFQHMLESLRIKPLPCCRKMYDIFWNHVLSHMRIYDGVMEFMQKLKSQKFKIAVCTDLTAEIQHRKLEKLDLSELIDNLVTSEEVGVEKPDKRIFELTLQKLSCKAEECIFVGDSFEKDIVGAKDIGMMHIQMTGKFEDVINEFKNFLNSMKVSHYQNTFY
jgi:putative hydrolase of the HAD superfamily